MRRLVAESAARHRKTLPWRAERRILLLTAALSRRAIPLSFAKRGKANTAYPGPQRMRAKTLALRDSQASPPRAALAFFL
jgi:hypothetical protein